MSSEKPSTKTATIQMIDGAPQLMIHGKVVPPLIFFFNTEMPYGQQYLVPQVEMSAKAGVHIYSMCMPWPWFNDEKEEPDYSAGEAILQRFLDVDPDAYFIPRVHNDSYHLYPKLNQERPQDCILYGDGTVSEMESLASDWWAEKVEKGLRRAFRHYEKTPYADRIIGYIYGSEWFHHRFWDMGWDFSENNLVKFRQWLKERYGNNEALSKAWGVPGLTIQTAQIPALPTDTSPRSESQRDEPTRFLHDLPKEKNYVDFNEFSSDMVADALIRLSKAIKEETKGDKLSIQFYGYSFEVMGSCSGHQKMSKTIESPVMDMFVSPVSYDNRVGGGIAAFMTAVDSYPLNGKIWLVENDMRTSVMDMSPFTPEQIAGEDARTTQSSKETVNCVTRDFAALQTHRCGTWWMDLGAWASYNDPEAWKKIAALKKFYKLDGTPVKPYRPELAVVIDENALRHMRFLKWRNQEGGLLLNDAFDNAMYYGRHMMYRIGASVGYYYFEDFLSGKLPPCKAYFFPCSYYMTEEQIEAVNQRLDREKATAIWQYAPAYLGPTGGDAARSSRLTGIGLAQRDGRLGSQGWRKLHGLTWGFNMPASPRLTVTDSENTTLILGDAMLMITPFPPVPGLWAITQVSSLAISASLRK